jgi:hypothetical protein
MSGQHTQGRLVVDAQTPSVLISDANHADTVTYATSVADARRLAACWNALVGVPTDEIEAMGGVVLFKGKPLNELANLRAERDQLRAEIAAADAAIGIAKGFHVETERELGTALALLREVLDAHKSGSIAMMSSDPESGMPIAETSYSFDGVLDRIRALLEHKP